jgi:hypothetical protein
MLLDDEAILDLQSANELIEARPSKSFQSMIDLIKGGPAALDAARGLARKAPDKAIKRYEAVTLRPPIPVPPRFRVTFLFQKHLPTALRGFSEMAANSADDPKAAFESSDAFWQKTVPSDAAYQRDLNAGSRDRLLLSGSGAKVPWRSESDWIDFELEVCAVIGDYIENASPEEAKKKIFGYTLFNDTSARDTQFIGMALGGGVRGKESNGSYPCGPCIATADEFDVYKMKTVLKVNGEIWGEGDMGKVNKTYEAVISGSSFKKPWHPGELLTCSTVEGCCGLEMRKSAKRGDVVELIGEGIGTLRTYIV